MGVVIGAVTAVAYLGLVEILDLFSAALLAVAFSAIVTGAFHEDGLADTADALGGASQEQRLEIMRDSRVVTLGAPALVLVTLGKVGALQSIGGTDAFIGLIAADALGRTTALVLMLTLPTARPAGLGAAYTTRLPRRLVTVVVVVFVAAAASSGVAGLAALGAVFGVVVLTAAVAHRRFGGLTGDVLGAAEQLSELAVLLVLSQLSDAATWF